MIRCLQNNRVHGLPGLSPLASIGIPVYQGEDFLDKTLQSARNQKHEPLEIVVSDNASTDSTAAIVAQHAGADSRIRGVVQVENVGAAENYNAVFRESKGIYFAWNAHDDYSSPDFVFEGVRALEATPDAVVALPRTLRVDTSGAVLEEMVIPDALFSASRAIRFRAAARAEPEAVIFGLFRSDVLRSTALHGHFTGSDRNLVAELLLMGPAVMAGDSEFYLREHDNRSVRRLGRGRSRFSHPREGWYAPQRSGKMVFPSWRRLGSYLSTVSRADNLTIKDRSSCYVAIVRLLFDDRMRLTKYLLNDVVTSLVFMRRTRRG